MRADFGPEYYNDPAYFHTQGKVYRTADGELRHWGFAKGGWDGFRTIIIPGMRKAVADLGRVLDIGAGCGSFVDCAVRSGIDAWGTDFAPFAVEHPEGQAGGRLKLGDCRDIPYPDQSFDTIVAFDLLEHIYFSDVPKVLSEIRRVAKSWVFVNVCCTPTEAGSYVLEPGQDIPPELEVLAVAGHVTVKSYPWWVERWTEHGLDVDWGRTHTWVDSIYPVAPNWLPHYCYVLKRAATL